jgi:rhodanese-related sulfurtransferase
MTAKRRLASRLAAIACLAGPLLILAGCGGEPGFDRQGVAAALAKTVAAEADHVDAAELADWIIKDRRDFTLVDIRGRADFDASHIDGARHVPLAGLLADEVLAALPPGRKVVLYSNGTAHAAQAAILLRLVERDAYALLGGYNYWQAYLRDPATAGVAGMAPAERAAYQAVACYFEGDYIAAAGLAPRSPASPASPAAPAAAEAPVTDDPLGLGLGLGLGSQAARDAVAPKPSAPAPAADPLGLGLGLGLGSDEVRSAQPPAQPDSKPKRLLIKAEC